MVVSMSAMSVMLCSVDVDVDVDVDVVELVESVINSAEDVVVVLDIICKSGTTGPNDAQIWKLSQQSFVIAHRGSH